MRILIFSAPFFPRKSGVGDYIFRLSKKLIKIGHKVTVFSYDTEKTKRYNEKLNKIKIFRVKNKNIFGVYFWPNKDHLKSQLKKLEQKRFDLVLTNTRFFHSSIVGMRFAKKNKIFWIHVEHGSTFVQTNNPVIWIGSRLFDITMGKKILNNANKIVAISNSAKNFVKKLSSRKKINYIPNGIELTNIPKKKSKKEIKNLIFVGRLIYAKGVQDLIKAFYIIDNKNLKLTIIGNGPYRKKLEGLVKRLNLMERIFFIGEKNKKEVMKILSQSDLFVNPSYSEGLPTSILEAGAVGMPIIATNVGGTKEIIINKRTGLLIKKKDITSLKKSIEFMIKNRNIREKYSTNLNKLIFSTYNWEEIMNEWKRIIEN